MELDAVSPNRARLASHHERLADRMFHQLHRVQHFFERAIDGLRDRQVATVFLFSNTRNLL